MASKYPFEKMEIGNSFIFPSSMLHGAKSSAATFRRAHPEFKFSFKEADDKPGYYRCKRVYGMSYKEQFEIEQ